MAECEFIGSHNNASNEVQSRLEQLRQITTDAMAQAEQALTAIAETEVIGSQAKGITQPNTGAVAAVTIPPAIVLTIPTPEIVSRNTEFDTSGAQFGLPTPPTLDASRLRITTTAPPTEPQLRTLTAPSPPQLSAGYTTLQPPTPPTLNTDPTSGITPPDDPQITTALLEQAMASEPPAPTLTLTLPAEPVAPTFASITTPAAMDASLRPGDPPTAPTVTLPTAPAIVLPSPPGLHTLSLPTAPTVNIAALQAQFAALFAQIPAPPALTAGDWWGEQARAQTTVSGWVNTVVARYASFAVTDTRLAELLSGTSTGLPAAVEDALRARAYRDVDDQAAADEQRVTEEFAARGFSLPSGPLLLRLDEVRQQGRNAKQKLRMDIFVQAAEWEIKNLQFAVQQGIQYEGQMRQHALAVMDLDRQMATDATQALKQTADLLLAAYTAQVEMVKTKVAFLTEWTRLELAKLDVYKAEIEGEIAKGNLDRTAVDAYQAQLQGVLTQVQVYKTQIEAESVRLDVGKLELAAYQAKVQAYAEAVRAWATEWEGYAAQTKAHQAAADLYQAQAQSFATKLKALSDVEQAKGALYESQMRGFAARLQNAGMLAQAQTGVFDALVRAYVAQVTAATGIEQAKVELARSATADFAARLQALISVDQAQVGVFEAEVRRFATELQAEQTKASIFDTQVRGYIGLHQADSAYNQNVLAFGDLDVKNAQITATNLGSKTQAFLAKLDEDKALYQAQLGAYQASAQVYDTTIRSQATAAGLLFESTKVALEKARIELVDALERYKTEMTKAMEDAKVRAQLADAAGRVAAQIASGALAAAHVSASIASNYGASDSSSCQTSYNYSL